MTTPLDEATINTIQSKDAEQRFKYLVKEVVSNREIWILKDEHGCVMLNTEDEDAVPVWPNREFAQSWATGDWQECEPESVSLNKWHSRWTHGLEDDDLAVVIFPDQNEEGLIISPEELGFELKKQSAKSK